MEITIKIQAPELAHAIETLAIAIGCTVDKIGVGEAIKEAVDQGPKEDKQKKSSDKKTDDVKQADPSCEQSEVIEDSTETNGATYTIEQVREAFMAKNSKSNTAKLKAILKKHDVAKVTDLPEESFADVIKELEAI